MWALGSERVEESAAAGHEVGDADDSLGESRLDGAELMLDPGSHRIGRNDAAFDGVDAEDAAENSAFRRGKRLDKNGQVSDFGNLGVSHAVSSNPA
jgi:hypothetical protein